MALSKMGKGTKKYMKQKIGHIVPGYSFDWFAFKPQMLHAGDKSLHNIFSQRLHKKTRKKTGGIGEALLPEIILSSGYKYAIMVEKGTRGRKDSYSCFEDGLGLSHCHNLQSVEHMSK